VKNPVKNPPRTGSANATGPAHPVVSRDEWLRARTALLKREKEHTLQRDELNLERLALPWVRVDEPYRFTGPDGEESLADLFRGRSQLLVYHFMFGPEWAEGCPSCSLIADHIDGARVHLENRDVTLLAVSRAPLAKLETFKKRMGWRFPWLSSHGSSFNHNFGVSFTPEELARGKVFYNYRMDAGSIEDLPGVSAFYKDADGSIYHTYSSYARGVETPIGAYAWLDFAPKGRDEDGLAFSMAWVRHHDKYESGQAVDCCAGYRPPEGAAVAPRPAS